MSHLLRSQRLYVVALVIFVAAIACLVGDFVVSLNAIARHRQVKDRMDVAVLRLAENRPEELTEDQWAYCVMWTWNLHSNYGTVHTYVPTGDLARIERQLQTRIDNGVELATIDWIWDQYIEAYPRARHYDHFRPTAPHNEAEFEAGHHGGNPLSQWKAEYKRKRTQQEL